jgi:hypothetical protein
MTALTITLIATVVAALVALELWLFWKLGDGPR